MPTDADLLPDPIQTMDFGEARSIEDRIQVTYDRRNAAIWRYLALPVDGGEPSPLPGAP